MVLWVKMLALQAWPSEFISVALMKKAQHGCMQDYNHSTVCTRDEDGWDLLTISLPPELIRCAGSENKVECDRGRQLTSPLASKSTGT